MKTKIFDVGTRVWFFARSVVLFVLGGIGVFMTNETHMAFLSFGVGIGFFIAGLVAEE